MAHRSPRHRLSAEAAQRELRPAAAGDETDAHLRQKDLLGALAAARTAHPSHLREIAKRSPGEPHRQFLLYAAARIAATRDRDADLAYPSPDELLADLRAVQDSLAGAGAARQAYGRVQTLRTVAWIQGRFGVRACHRYIVSFTRSADDIANVHELAASLGDGAPVLDVIPLFETGEDLERAPSVLDGMLRIPAVQDRLDATGRRLEVMLGYSDSAKQLGTQNAFSGGVSGSA